MKNGERTTVPFRTSIANTVVVAAGVTVLGVALQAMFDEFSFAAYITGVAAGVISIRLFRLFKNLGTVTALVAIGLCWAGAAAFFTAVSPVCPGGNRPCTREEVAIWTSIGGVMFITLVAMVALPFVAGRLLVRMVKGAANRRREAAGGS